MLQNRSSTLVDLPSIEVATLMECLYKTSQFTSSHSITAISFSHSLPHSLYQTHTPSDLSIIPTIFKMHFNFSTIAVVLAAMRYATSMFHHLPR